jgi:PPOX class probable F420-dependent enzyme
MPGYGVLGPSEGTGLLPWEWATERLTRSHDYWLATVWPGGRPHVTPVWGVWRDNALWFSCARGSRKARNLEADPRVAISIVDHDEPYKMAQIRGRVVETVGGDEALAIMDRMSLRYTGKPFPHRQGVAVLIEPEKVFWMTLPFEHTPGA